MKYANREHGSWSERATVYAACSVDALVIVGYLLVVDLVTLGTGLPEAPRALLALPLVVFLPGYALTAVLFPRTTASFPDSTVREPFARAVEGVLAPTERAALAFGATLALVPLVGLVHSVAGLGYGTTALFGTVNAVIVSALCLAVVRRVRASPADRVAFSPRTWPTRLKAAVWGGSRSDTLLTVVVLVVALAATSSLAVALVAPPDGESFTTVTLLTENESGALVMDDYPETPASAASLVVAVDNNEDQRIEYTMVTQLQSVRDANGSEPTVVARRELARGTRTLDAGETWLAERSVGPPPEPAGDRFRFVALVYRGSAPDDPTVANAYRYVDLSLSANTNTTG